MGINDMLMDDIVSDMGETQGQTQRLPPPPQRGHSNEEINYGSNVAMANVRTPNGNAFEEVGTDESEGTNEEQLGTEDGTNESVMDHTLLSNANECENEYEKDVLNGIVMTPKGDMQNMHRTLGNDHVQNGHSNVRSDEFVVGSEGGIVHHFTQQ